MRLPPLLAALVLFAPAAAHSQLFFSQDSNPNGLFEIDPATGAATLVGAGQNGWTTQTVGLSPSAQRSVLFGSTFADITRILADGSSATVLPGSAEAEGLAFCSSTGTFYGTINDPFSNSFFTIDTTTGVQIAALAAPPADVEGLACDPVANQVYGIGDTTDLLVYDVAAGSWSVVGDTGINWDSGGLAFDPAAAVLYAVGQGGGDNLYTLDPSTAQPTLVGATGVTPSQGGLAFVPPPSLVEIPTLAPWGLALLVGLLGAMAVVTLRRGRGIG